MFVKEKMTKHLYVARPDEDVQIVYARMVELHVRHMPVIEAGQLVGVLSDRDMLLYAKPGKSYAFPQGLLVKDVMAKNLVTASPEMSLASIAQKMIDHSIDALPILRSDGRVVGLVTSTDLMRLIANHELETPQFRTGSEPIGSYAWELCEDIV